MLECSHVDYQEGESLTHGDSPSVNIDMRKEDEAVLGAAEDHLSAAGVYFFKEPAPEHQGSMAT
jgi:hypothetical protein